MKKIIFITVIINLTITAFTQEIDRSQWMTQIDTSAFDGIRKICGVFGKSNNETYTTPQIGIMKLGNGKLSMYLTYWPYGGCDGNKLYVKFDKEIDTYSPRVVYVPSSEQFGIIFQDAKMVTKYPHVAITEDQFIQKLKTCKVMYIRLISQCVSIDVEFTLENADEALKLVE